MTRTTQCREMLPACHSAMCPIHPPPTMSPDTACVCMGAQVYELEGAELKLIKESEKPSSFKCGTFGASSLVERRLATGNFAGQLQIWDLESMAKPVFEVQAHASIVNALDGCGGQVGRGEPTWREGRRVLQPKHHCMPHCQTMHCHAWPCKACAAHRSHPAHMPPRHSLPAGQRVRRPRDSDLWAGRLRARVGRAAARRARRGV